jgi:NAD(P)-dependent dehydrogenase (short-subunit alcohol dehydrogenase family)
MTGSTALNDDVYKALSDEELANWPTVFRDGLFKDQVVLISGAAGGIGHACSILFGRLGATIFGCGRDAGKLEALREDLAKLGIESSMRAMTVRDPEQVAALIDEVWECYGRMDVLINNAGGQFAAPAFDITPKGWHAVVETILYGSWYMMQAAARHWRDRAHPGSVVNMATVMESTAVGIPHMAAARAGQINVGKSLSVEWAPYRIRINSISIGVVASPGLVNYPPTARPSFGHNPMRRPGDVMDVAEAAVYLCAPSGKFITGAVLHVDGGEHVWGEYWPLGKPDYFKVDE